MKQYRKWLILASVGAVMAAVGIILLFLDHQTKAGILFIVVTAVLALAFSQLWQDVRRYGVQTELDISRVLGKDAKDALSFGNVGILTYNDEYTVTWQSPFFKERGIDLVNHQLTSWIREIRDLFEEEVDYIVGYADNSAYEIMRKADSNILYVKDITNYQNLSQKYMNSGTVVGIIQLDNYVEYQSYENEALMEQINTHLRAPILKWAHDNGMLIRRFRSDRFFVVLNQGLFEKIRKDNFTILQIVKDEAHNLDVSITLSMAFAYGTEDFNELDSMVSELLELAQSRGGDQVAFRNAKGRAQFVGGNSENSSSRSKVRVHTMAQSIQGAVRDAENVYIAGHTVTDFDCMGAALAVSGWCRALGKKVFIVLDGVPWDDQLTLMMQRYKKTIRERHTFISPLEAADQIDYDRDLLIMVDHAIPAISSAKDFIDTCKNIIVIDHHRKNEQFVKHTMLSYVESTASSTCELITELLQIIPNHVPIYETEATIMYLGIIVDTNRFKMHTDARTFEAAAALRSWGANAKEAEKALTIDWEDFNIKNKLLSEAKVVDGRFMIMCTDTPVEKTMLATTADTLLSIQGCQAAFAMAPLKGKTRVTALSARGAGDFNVQKVIEKLQGGGHFSAAAVERGDLKPEELKQELLNILQEEEHESHSA